MHECNSFFFSYSRDCMETEKYSISSFIKAFSWLKMLERNEIIPVNKSINNDEIITRAKC